VDEGDCRLYMGECDLGRAVADASLAPASAATATPAESTTVRVMLVKDIGLLTSGLRSGMLGVDSHHSTGRILRRYPGLIRLGAVKGVRGYGPK